MLGVLKIKSEHWRILKKISALKFVEGIFIILTAKILVELVNNTTAEIFAEFFIFFSARFLVANFSSKQFLKLSLAVQTDFRKKLHEEIFSRELSSGELLTIIFDTVQTLNDFFVKVLPNFFATIILIPLFLFSALATDFLTAIILLVTLPIAPFLMYLIGKATAEKNSVAWNELQKLNGEFKELLSAITTLKMFGRIDTATKKLKATSEKSSAATLDVLKLAFVSSFALELITTLSIALVAVTLGLRLINGGINFESALFLLLIAPEFFLPVRKLGTAFHVIISSRQAFERLENFLNSEKKSAGTIEKIKMPPEILVENLKFVYPKKKSPALDEINLKIQAGKITAITGESGCGKTTLLKLFAGLYLPTEGEIFFSGLPISKIQPESLAEKISYMPQAPHLFETSLAKNFSMFGVLDEKDLQKFLVALNLQNLNLSAEQKLSRGQLQRLGLIRALLKNSSLILLDEPTAGLDTKTEKKVLDLLKNFSYRKTIIIATHRAAVINFSDAVIKLTVK